MPVCHLHRSCSLRLNLPSHDTGLPGAGRGKDALADVGMLRNTQLAVYVQDNKRVTHVFGWDATLHLWAQVGAHALLDTNPVSVCLGNVSLALPCLLNTGGV